MSVLRAALRCAPHRQGWWALRLAARSAAPQQLACRAVSTRGKPAAAASEQPPPAAQPLFELRASEALLFPELLTPGTHAVLLGIDPDLHGSVAALQWRNPPTGLSSSSSSSGTDIEQHQSSNAVALDGLQLSVHDMPVEVWEMGTRSKRQPAARGLIDLLHRYATGHGLEADAAAAACAAEAFAGGAADASPPVIIRAVLENSQPLHMSGKHAWYGIGFSIGLITGLLTLLDVPHQRVHSSTWKRAMGLVKTGKDGSLALARQAFPAAALPYLSRKKDHGRAEALLLAAYGLGVRAKPLPGLALAPEEAAEPGNEGEGERVEAEHEDENLQAAQVVAAAPELATGRRGRGRRKSETSEEPAQMIDEDLWIAT